MPDAELPDWPLRKAREVGNIRAAHWSDAEPPAELIFKNTKFISWKKIIPKKTIFQKNKNKKNKFWETQNISSSKTNLKNKIIFIDLKI